MENNEVKFNEPSYGTPRRRIQHNSFVSFLIKKGLAKNEQQAIYILFGVIGITITISILILISSKPTYTPKQQEQPPAGWVINK